MRTVFVFTVFVDIRQTQSHDDGPFLWSRTEQGSVLSSFYWGYLFVQIPAGGLLV